MMLFRHPSGLILEADMGMIGHHYATVFRAAEFGCMVGMSLLASDVFTPDQFKDVSYRSYRTMRGIELLERTKAREAAILASRETN
jgi:hypothetical protein